MAFCHLVTFALWKGQSYPWGASNEDMNMSISTASGFFTTFSPSQKALPDPLSFLYWVEDILFLATMFNLQTKYTAIVSGFLDMTIGFMLYILCEFISQTYPIWKPKLKPFFGNYIFWEKHPWIFLINNQDTSTNMHGVLFQLLGDNLLKQTLLPKTRNIEKI